jgi:hypothetical protein
MENGGFASGARAAEQLSMVATEVRMVPTMLDELVWFSRVLREARATRT